jgi:hypothetical protein
MTFFIWLSWFVWSIDYRKRRNRNLEAQMREHLAYCARLRARKTDWVF